MKVFYLLLIAFIFNLTACVSIVPPLPSAESDRLAADLNFLAKDKTGLYHTVKHGDTLWKISKQYGTTIESIERENQAILKGSRMLKTGQKLFIPSKNDIFKPSFPAEYDFIWPAKGPLAGKSSKEGIRIKAPQNSNVYAVKSGRVTYVDETFRGYGKVVVIKHSDGFVSLYGYNSKITVKPGTQVKQGQTIAYVGETGRADSPQLYFMLMKNGSLVNPTYYLK